MTTNAFLKLPFFFSKEKLLNDLKICESYEFVKHFNKQDYEGSWTSIALRSLDGSNHSILAYTGEETVFKSTPLLLKCNYFKKIIEQFQCNLESVRLLNLAPRSIIKEHRDRGLAYSEGCFRLHIPITTNNGVEFRIDGSEVSMEIGSCWYGNFDLPHQVKNEGLTPRIHLVIDGLRNAWTDQIFAESGYDFKVDEKQIDTQTQLLMLKELERMNTEVAQKIAQDIRSALGI